ncbi:MAG: AbrB/MazE/SpoVT family DNA-binding domain-containing protein [Planctomycetota bacterium]
MIKQLKKHGNSQALPVDKATMDALGIDLDTPLQVTVSGDALIVTPAEVGIGDKDVDASAAKMRRRYGRMLKRLAE